MNIKEYIQQCQRAYYEGVPLISNEEYDALVRMYPEYEEHIGHKGELKHAFQVWSLDKVYPCRGDELPDPEPYVETPKLDGCAVTLLYVDHTLTLALTRGDGIAGRDVTNNIKHIVATDIAFSGIIQIRGEVVNTTKVENARNYASGAVNLDSEAEFLERVKEGELTFVAYGIKISNESEGYSGLFTGDMGMLHRIMPTVCDKNIKELCDSGDIPTDGIVWRLNNNEDYFNAGHTHKFHKGAFAIKEDSEVVWTTLRDVQWQVGKSGKVTPVAIFDEINLEDAKTTRATLNNVAYMEAMGITHIGQEIGLIRAGGIIPKIVEAKPYE